jgi:hypothetical protein
VSASRALTATRRWLGNVLHLGMRSRTVLSALESCSLSVAPLAPSPSLVCIGSQTTLHLIANCLPYKFLTNLASHTLNSVSDNVFFLL